MPWSPTLRPPSRPGAHVVFSSASIPGEVVDVISVDSTVISRREAAVVELVRGFERARRYAADHPEADALMAAREGLKVEEFRAALRTGVQLVPLVDQDDFLRPGGRLSRVDALVVELLTRTGELTHPASTAGLQWAGAANAVTRSFRSGAR
jgi:ABC-type nitrate/sulfonate/bicarbonate transport system substrate-binding protein